MFIDSHAHIDGPEFNADREQVLDRARLAGVGLILNVGTGDPHSEAFDQAVQLGETNDAVYTAIGTHPHDARHYDDVAEEKTKRLISQSSKVVAWGEIGLDFHYNNSPRDNQTSAFTRQLSCAAELNLPVIIHTREAEAETIEILKRDYGHASRRGVFHCFSGTLELAKAALEIGFFISFSGILTFKKADELRAIAKYVPLDRLLVETDCPFLAPVPFRGKRNEPAFVVEVARVLASVRGVDVEDIECATTENFMDLFKLGLSN